MNYQRRNRSTAEGRSPDVDLLQFQLDGYLMELAHLVDDGSLGDMMVQ